MIILYGGNGKELGRYDTPSDVWADYPDANIKNGTATTKENE